MAAPRHMVDRCSCCRVCQMAGHRPDEARLDQPIGRGAIDDDEHVLAAGHGPHEGHTAGTDRAGHHAHGIDGDGADHGAHTDHDGHADHAGHEQMFRRRFWVCLALSAPVLIWSQTFQDWFGYDAPELPGSDSIVPVFATVIFLYGGLPFLTMATRELRSGGPGMMTLISLAISVAYGYSMATLVWDLGDDFFWELVTLVDIMLLGHWMEMRSVRQASGALGALAQLMPDTAMVIRSDGSVEPINAAELAVGDIVLIKPGASVPADGTVVDGDTEVDEAMITGESRPQHKVMGSDVVAGTINVGNSSVRAEVTATGDETALAGIMRLVAEAETSTSPTQLLADRAAALLFYFAIAAAAITALAWSLYFGGPDQRTIARVVTVLVIACPHALGLAIPLVIAITTETAARNGALIRRREAIDSAKDLSVIAVDKTGTLTEGRMGLVDMTSSPMFGDHRALVVAAAVEGDSEHLIARAIRASSDDRGFTRPAVSGFEVMKGRGVKGIVDGATYYAGGPRLLEYLNPAVDEQFSEFARRAGRAGHTVVFLVSGPPATPEVAVVATFAIADVVRIESRDAVNALREIDVDVVMLTGDSDEVARSVASEVGIDTYHAEVLPADKDEIVQELQMSGDLVGMVGDGVNDAPALTRADIGIAIGSGTDVAVESADLVLVKSNPIDIVKVLRLSGESYRKQLQNIWWGAGYNIVMIPLAAGVLAPWGFVMPPAVGAVLMSLSTIIVAINAQLLRRVELDKP